MLLLDDSAVESAETFETVDESALEAEHDGFSKARVAELSPGRIAQMSSGELSRAIRDVGVLRFCDESRLTYLDRPTLERLVYLARQCCRNQGY